MTVAEVRARMKPEQVYLLAELQATLAGSGIAGRSDVPGRAFVAPAGAPRRCGAAVVGRELLDALPR